MGLIRDIFTLDISDAADRYGLPDEDWQTIDQFQAGVEATKRATRVALLRYALLQASCLVPMLLIVAASVLASDLLSAISGPMVLLPLAAMLFLTKAPQFQAVAPCDDYWRVFDWITNATRASIGACLLASFSHDIASPAISPALAAGSVCLGILVLWKILQIASVWNRVTRDFLQFDECWQLAAMNISLRSLREELEEAVGQCDCSNCKAKKQRAATVH